MWGVVGGRLPGCGAGCDPGGVSVRRAPPAAVTGELRGGCAIQEEAHSADAPTLAPRRLVGAGRGRATRRSPPEDDASASTAVRNCPEFGVLCRKQGLSVAAPAAGADPPPQSADSDRASRDPPPS